MELSCRNMIGRLVLYMLTCGPLLLTIVAWLRLYVGRRWPSALALLALGIVSANAVLAAGTFLYYELRSLSHLPPWEGPEILLLGLLILLAPIGMVLGGSLACVDRPSG